MSTHAQAQDEDRKSIQALDAGASDRNGADVRIESLEDVGTISIELNFNAFADNVPPSKHAKRAPNYGDPSVQDFADQALELAALRAELKRLTRDYESVKRQLRMRDSRLDALRRELASAQAQLREARKQTESPGPQVDGVAAKSNDDSPPVAGPVPPQPLESMQPSRPELTSTLEIPLTEAEHSGAVPQSKAREAASPPAHPEGSAASGRIPAQLIPMDPPGDPIHLSRDIVTVGRTRNNDVCIPSRAVSRDHARLLVSRSTVTIVDIGSANGCFVNDEPVKRQKLQDGDLLCVGDRTFRFTIVASADS